MDLSLMVGDTKFNYRVGLFIIRNNQVLVECNPDYDFVTLPGGRVKTQESSLEALRRELNEEMQIDIGNDKLLMKALVENFFDLEGKHYHELYFLYKLDVTGDERFVDEMKNHDSKASYYKWVDSDKLADVNLLPVVLRNLSNDDVFKNIVEK